MIEFRKQQYNDWRKEDQVFFLHLSKPRMYFYLLTCTHYVFKILILIVIIMCCAKMEELLQDLAHTKLINFIYPITLLNQEYMYKLCFTHFEMKSFLHADKRSIVRIFIIFSYLFIHLFILMQQTSRVENINQSGNTHCINIHSPGVSGAIGNTFQLLRSARILCRIKVSGIA